MPRVLFVNRFYWPDVPATGQLLTDLAEALARRGHVVTVIASRPAHDLSTVPERRGVTIIRVAGSRLAHGRLAGKALAWGTFFVGSLRQIWRHARPDTIVVAMTDPPLLAVGAWIAARLRGARLIQWVQDIYPEIAIELTGQGWLRVLRPPRNAAWRAAHHCITLGTDMAGVLAHAGVPRDRISIIHNWAPIGVDQGRGGSGEAFRTAWGLTGKFVLAYSGNLGRVHDLEPVLGLAAALRADAGIAIIFIGSGAQHEHLVAEVSRRGLNNVSFHPPQPREQLAEVLAVGDVHLVTLRPGCERFVFPSKLQGIAAVPRPMIFIGPPDCEVARCVVENQLGYAATRDEIPKVAGLVRHLVAHRDECARFSAAGSRYTAHHTAEAAAQRWHVLLTEVGGSRPAGVSANQDRTT